jgi:hypothetical protein
MTAETFGALVEAREFPAISIYMPTHRAGRQVQQDPIRLRNLLGDARRALVADTELRGAEINDLMEPATVLLEDSGFWQRQEDGLALFLSSAGLDTFRLPASFPEVVTVGDAFHVKPLLGVLTRGERFSVLGLSRRRVRLLEATRFRIEEIDLGDLPVSMSDVLRFEDLERQLQFHQSGTRGRGRPTAVFHGQGMGKETSRKRLERFFRKVDEGIRGHLEPDVPLVLAGVDYLLPIYRKVSRHPLVLEGEITGKHDDLSDDALRERAWEIAQPHFDKERASAAAALLNGVAPTEHTIEAVLPAAGQGRVAALFVDPTAAEWGVFTGTTVVRHSTAERGDRDLVDAAIAETWRHRGSVYLGLPEGAPDDASVAAVLRY